MAAAATVDFQDIPKSNFNGFMVIFPFSIATPTKRQH